MNTTPAPSRPYLWPKLAGMPLPAKTLVTATILTMAIALLGALGQIIVHDVIPTFFAGKAMPASGDQQAPAEPEDAMPARGDLFGQSAPTQPEPKPFYKEEQFVWTLKWTHIHLFGMSMIFIFMGAVTLFLDLGLKTRAWLIGLPFAGVLVDIAAMWLKGYISPAFFWLHVPGGGLFGAIFLYVTLRALWEMWGPPASAARRAT